MSMHKALIMFLSSVAFRIPSDYPEIWMRWTKKYRGKGSVKRKRRLRVAGIALMVFFILLYLLLGWGFAMTFPGGFIGYGVSTLICFGIVYLLCRWKNAPRPYEVFDMKPLIPSEKLKRGRSFPSLSAFFAFMTAVIGAFIFRDAASVVFLVLAIILGRVRVLEGANFLKDVVFGGIFGIIAAGFCIAIMLAGIV